MNKGKQLAKNTLLYAVGNFGSKILTFLVVPLYTYYIDTSSMGTYDAIVTAVSLLSPIIVMSIYEGIYRWIIQNKDHAGMYIRYGFLFEFRNLLIGSIVYIVIGQFKDIPYFWTILLYTVLSCIHNYIQKVTRALGNTKLFAITGLIYTGIYLGCNVIFITKLSWGVRSLFLSTIIGCFITTGIMIVVQWHDIWERTNHTLISKEEKNGIFRYSIAITPNDICWWIVGLSDRFALIWFVSTSANGIYSISQKFPTIITMMTTIFYMAWQDQSVGNYGDKDKDEYYTKIFRVYSRILFCGSLCLIPLTKYVILWLMETSYSSAWYYVMPLYIGTVFSALASFLGVGYLGSKQTGKALTTTILAAVVNIGINLVFMPIFPQYGIFIASCSTMISYMVLYIARAIQTKQYFTIKFSKIEMVLFVALNLVYGTVIFFTSLEVDIILLILAVIISVWFLKEYVYAAGVVIKKYIHAK